MRCTAKTSEIERALKRYTQWFGSYKACGELKKVRVCLTIRDGLIEFITPPNSYKVKRVRRNPRVICFIGSEDGPSVTGTAEVVTDKDAIWRAYRAYWKTRPLAMLFYGFWVNKEIKAGRRVLVRVRLDEPNPFAGLTDPIV